jgi:hypothetical protein
VGKPLGSGAFGKFLRGDHIVCDIQIHIGSVYLGKDIKTERDVQSLKKLSQCLAILQRLSCRKSNKLHNNLKVTYIILCHRDFRISFISCDLVQN